VSEVFDIPMARTRVGWGARVALDPAAAPAEPEPSEEVPRIARTLALAHVMQRMIDGGEVKDQAELARMLGFTRARVTQMLDLTLLAPDIQEAILAADALQAGDARHEGDLRGLAGMTWRRQRAAWTPR
jgi:ParB-like chromosome segregation protein Spo0J